MRALRIAALSLIVMVVTAMGAQAQKYTLSGRVVNSDQEPVAYATVVVTSDNS